MDRLAAMQVFVEVADKGSLTSASQSLDMSRPMVSRHLESLERWLGVRLFHRTTRRVSLTEAGAEALERCRRMLELAGEVQAAAGNRVNEASGRLRIATSTSLAQACLASAVADFLTLHPQVEIELLAHERAVNMVEERIDLAVRIGNQLDESLVARRLGDCRSVLCASPAYLSKSGMPTSPESLASHRCISHAYVSSKEILLNKGKKQVHAPFNGALHTNESTVARQAALSGAGIALLPAYLVSADLIDKKLIRVLSDYEPEVLGINAVYLSRQHQPKLLRLMIDFLASYFNDQVNLWEREISLSSTKK